jgi:hypothetical protein
MNEEEKKLAGWEMWVADHAGPIFAAVALAIVVGAIAIFVVFLRAGSAQDQVNVLKPQVTRVNKAICDKQSLGHTQRAERCAERIRVGLINCRHSNPCRAAFLAIATYPPKARSGSPSSTTASTTAPSSSPKGVMPQQPSSHGHQQPGPGSPGHSGGDHGQEASPAPSPGSSAAPGASAAPEASPPPETPGNGAQGGSTSGADVEVCALERCVGAEVDVSPKGLTP